MSEPTTDNPYTRVFWMRLERGKAQLEALTSEIDAYCASVRQGDAFAIGCEKDPDSDSYRHRLLVLRPPDHVRWTVLVGELVQNLRVPLDQLAYALVKSTGAAPTLQTSFPVYDKRERYDGTAPKWNGTSGVRKARGMDSDAATVIESLQPYQRTKMGEGLLILDKLWRTDKHLLPLAATGSSKFLIGSTVSWGEVEPDFRIDPEFSFEHENIIGTSNKPMDIHIQIEVEMRFREAGPWTGMSVGDALTRAGEAAFDAMLQLDRYVKWSAI